MRLARSAIQPPPSPFTASTTTRCAYHALYPTRGGGWLAYWGATSTRGSPTTSTDPYRLPESMRHAPPQLLQPGITSAAGSVELVPHRIFDVKILVIIFSAPELSGRHDRCDDIVLERFRLREHPLGDLGEAFLLVGVIEDRGAVLASYVAKLPVSHGRIDVFPEHFEELFVSHLLRLVGDLHNLRAPRGSRGHLLVAGILLGSPHIAGGRGDHARQGVVGRFHAPETAARKCGYRLPGSGLLAGASERVDKECCGEQAAWETHVRFLRDSNMSLPQIGEHTSELQSHVNIVCRLLLEKKKNCHQAGVQP